MLDSRRAPPHSMPPLDSKPAALATAVLAGLLGASSLLWLGVFLLAGPRPAIDLGLQGASLHLWNAALSIAFFAQHSIMIRSSFQDRWLRGIPPHSRRACFAIASGIFLLPILLFWQESDLLLVAHVEAIWWVVIPAWLLGITILAWGMLALRSDMLGIDPLLAHLRSQPLPSPRFVIRGPYRIVRHPLYLGTLLLIWASPRITLDRLLFDVLWTAWILIGVWLEERDLRAEFGEPYQRYQREVPMLLPGRPRREPPRSG
jgi:methanethiol S-methyltransferase